MQDESRKSFSRRSREGRSPPGLCAYRAHGRPLAFVRGLVVATHELSPWKSSASGWDAGPGQPVRMPRDGWLSVGSAAQVILTILPNGCPRWLRWASGGWSAAARTRRIFLACPCCVLTARAPRGFPRPRKSPFFAAALRRLINVLKLARSILTCLALLGSGERRGPKWWGRLNHP